MLPIKNVTVKAPFICVDVCSLQMMGSGRTSMTTSVTMLGNVLQTKKASLSRQKMACSGGGAQLAENGLQATRSTMTQTMLVQTSTMASTIVMIWTGLWGKRRRKKRHIATLDIQIVAKYHAEMATRYLRNSTTAAGFVCSRYSTWYPTALCSTLPI